MILKYSSKHPPTWRVPPTINLPRHPHPHHRGTQPPLPRPITSHFHPLERERESAFGQTDAVRTQTNPIYPRAHNSFKKKRCFLSHHIATWSHYRAWDLSTPVVGPATQSDFPTAQATPLLTLLFPIPRPYTPHPSPPSSISFGPSRHLFDIGFNLRINFIKLFIIF